MEDGRFRNPRIVRDAGELRPSADGIYSYSIPGGGNTETLDDWLAAHRGLFEGFGGGAERVTAGADGGVRRDYLLSGEPEVRERLAGVLDVDFAALPREVRFEPGAGYCSFSYDGGGALCAAWATLCFRRGGGWLRLELCAMPSAELMSEDYVFESCYERVYHYVSARGIEYLMSQNSSECSAECTTEHLTLSLKGFGQTLSELEGVLDGIGLPMLD